MDNRLKNIEDKLDDHGVTLKEISATMEKVAIQSERIKNIEAQQTTLWRKYDALADPQVGLLKEIITFQASCPRKQISFLWWFVGTVNTAILISLFLIVLK